MGHKGIGNREEFDWDNIWSKAVTPSSNQLSPSSKPSFLGSAARIFAKEYAVNRSTFETSLLKTTLASDVCPGVSFYTSQALKSIKVEESKKEE